MKISYRQANVEDASAIAALTASYSLQKAQIDQESGFLVSEYDETKYRELLEVTDFAFVALQEDQFVGFVMAFQNDIAPLTSNAQKACEEIQVPFILIKQVCVSLNHTKRGIAAYLYNLVLQAAGNQPVLAAIVTEPKNNASIAFHEKIGFSPYIQFTETDGMPRSFWKRGKE